jgi:hypothetical protein
MVTLLKCDDDRNALLGGDRAVVDVVVFFAGPTAVVRRCMPTPATTGAMTAL